MGSVILSMIVVYGDGIWYTVPTETDDSQLEPIANDLEQLAVKHGFPLLARG
jgi:hypothetical protein